ASHRTPMLISIQNTDSDRQWYGSVRSTGRLKSRGPRSEPHQGKKRSAGVGERRWGSDAHPSTRAPRSFAWPASEPGVRSEPRSDLLLRWHRDANGDDYRSTPSSYLSSCTSREALTSRIACRIAL